MATGQFKSDLSRKMLNVDCADELVKLKLLVKAQDSTAKQLRLEAARKDARIRDLEIQLTAARRKLAVCDVPHPDQRAEVKLLRHALEDADARVKEIERSLSWRLTMPLRGIGRSFR